MKSIDRRIVVVPFIVLLIWQIASSEAMGQKAGDMENAAAVTLSKSDNGKAISVKEGDTIRLELSGPGATGYIWEVVDLDTTCLEPLSHDTRPVATSPGLVGGPILYVWQFKAKTKGRTQLKLDYYRPWEGREKALDHYMVSVSID